MPHLKISGIQKEEVEKIANDLTNIIITTSNVPREYVKIFYNPIEYISGNEKNIVIIEVYWMKRPQEICDKLAEELTIFFKKRNFEFIQVNFTEFLGKLFYENGIHY